MGIETNCLHYLKKISETKNLFVLDPINQNIEKINFFKNKKYNPILKYEKNKIPNSFFSKIKQLEISKYKTLSYLMLKNQFEELNLINSCATNDFTKKSIDFYGTPSENLVLQATKILKNLKIIPDKEIITPEEVVIELKNHLKTQKLFGWSVKPAPITAKAITVSHKKTLYINNNLLFSKEEIKRLKAHEIDTHIMRFENSKQQIPIFHHIFPNYLSTEEGLAIYSEEMNGVLNQNRLAICAGRVIAVKLALNHSFSEVFEALSEYFDENDAWDITVRVKRGLEDTSMPGGFTKDYIYLKGYFEIKNYVKKGDSIKDLYVAKIGISNLRAIKKIKELKPPKYLPSYLRI